MLTQQLGEALKAERERQGLTQKCIAERMKCSESLVQNVEYHNRDFRLSTIQRYADALGVSLKVVVARTR